MSAGGDVGVLTLPPSIRRRLAAAVERDLVDLEVVSASVEVGIDGSIELKELNLRDRNGSSIEFSIGLPRDTSSIWSGPDIVPAPITIDVKSGPDAEWFEVSAWDDLYLGDLLAGVAEVRGR